MLESWRGTYAWWREHNPKPSPKSKLGEKVPKFPTEWRQPLNDLDAQFTRIRNIDRPEWGRVAYRVGKGVIRRFERTRTAFYKRCAAGGKPGYPRFKAAARWRTIEIVRAYPSMLVPPGERGNGSAKWWRLQVGGLPRLRFEDRAGRIRAALASGELVELRVVRTALRVEVHVIVKLPAPDIPDYEPANPVGIDKGLKTRLALSDSTLIAPRVPDRRHIKRKQRALARATKGSNSRAKKRTALAKAWARETEQARHADHRLAHELVTTFDAIAVEKLNVAGMLRSRLFSRKMSDQRWAALDAILEHKAGKAGVHYERVNPAYTSTDCSQCGHRQPMPMHVRVYRCGACGLVMDRDINSAINIRARPGWVRDREGQSPRCSARNKLLPEDEPTPRRVGTQADATEQYAETPTMGTQVYKSPNISSNRHADSHRRSYYPWRTPQV